MSSGIEIRSRNEGGGSVCKTASYKCGWNKTWTTLLQTITASEFRISLKSGRIDVLIVTEELTIDLGSCLRW